MALQSPAAREDAKRTIHYLGSRGFLEFRNLLEGGAADKNGAS